MLAFPSIDIMWMWKRSSLTLEGFMRSNTRWPPIQSFLGNPRVWLEWKDSQAKAPEGFARPTEKKRSGLPLTIRNTSHSSREWYEGEPKTESIRLWRHIPDVPKRTFQSFVHPLKWMLGEPKKTGEETELRPGTGFAYFVETTWPLTPWEVILLILFTRCFGEESKLREKPPRSVQVSVCLR